MVYEVKEDGQEVAVDFFCACAKCYKVYQFKDSNGKHFGTKNQIEHMKRCVGVKPTSQLTLKQCATQKVKLSTADHRLLKHKECYTV